MSGAAWGLRAAAFHYIVDKFGELPILVAVLVTGTILTLRAAKSKRPHALTARSPRSSLTRRTTACLKRDGGMSQSEFWFG